jgi:DNA replicative helicase MCM subunit Mcm2 (Cdc46/Mcm family)
VAFLQLCKASAKIRLSSFVELKDIKIALKILSKSYFRIPEYDVLKRDIFK